MRVLHVLDHSLPLQSGYAVRTLQILHHQRKMGFETYQLTGIKQGSTLDEVDVQEGLPFIRTPNNPNFYDQWPVLKQWYAIRALEHSIEKNVLAIKPHVLHVHSPVLNGLASLKVAKKHKIPVVYEIRAFWEDAAVDHKTHTEHSLRYRFSRKLETYMVKKAQHVTTICEGLKAELLLRGVDGVPITVVPNAIDLSTVKNSTDSKAVNRLKQQFELQNHFVIGYMGSFYAYEGLDLLLEAFALVKEQNPMVRLLLVGDGPEKARLQEQVRSLNLEKQVIMPGSVENDQIGLYYALCDLCVYPRRRIRLTELVTPLKPLEAMARGIPVLASNVGGHCEMIKHLDTGFLFEADSRHGLAKALSSIIKEANPMLMTYRAKNYVIEQRSWDKMVSLYQDVYQKALSV